jgi:hypothetical protein
LLDCSILIIYSHLHLGLPSGLFSSGTLTEPLNSPYVPHVSPISFYSILSPVLYLARGENRKVHNPLFFIHLLLPTSRCKVFPEHRTSEHSRSMLFAQCKTQIITPIQNKRKLYFFICLSLYHWKANLKTKDFSQNASRQFQSSVYSYSLYENRDEYGRLMLIMIIFLPFHNIWSDKIAAPEEQICSYCSTCFWCKVTGRLFVPLLPRDLSDLKTRTIALVKNIDAPMLARVGQELDYPIDVCLSGIVHTSNISSCQKNFIRFLWL